MKRMLCSLGLSLATSFAAQAQSYQSPAAVLGMPRAASLGFPVPADPNRPAILRVSSSDSLPPAVMPAGPAASTGPALSPYRLTSDPKQMPSNAKVDEGKVEQLGPPIPGAPASPPVYYQGAIPPTTYEGTILQDGVVAPPFLGGNRLQLSAEYLMWWTSGYTAPPLVTTGPAASNGIIGAPGVSTLFGNQSINTGLTSGLRVGGTWWFGPRQVWALDSHLFFLGQTGQNALFGSTGSPLLARPFNNLNTNSPSAELVADPGLYAGGIAISSTTSLWGSDFNLRRKLCEGCNSYIDGLVGYRYLSLSESLTITEESAALPPISPTSTVASGMAFDRFRTTNQFNGGQIGFVTGATAGRWVFNLRSTIAAGTTSSIVYIDGAQNVVAPSGAASVTPGGLYALNSNMGRYSRNLFSVVPEVNVNVGYNLTDHCRVYVGYNLIYWTSVLRPGNQIDQGLDVNRIPNFPGSATLLNSTHPIVPMVARDFLAQGLNFGLSLNW